MQNILAEQRSYFNSQVTKPIAFRIAQLNKLEKLIKLYEPRLYEAIYNDFKKSEFDTFVTELALIYQEIKEAKRHIHSWSKKERRKSTLANFPSKSYILKEPLGVCLVIGAWNYPYQLSLVPVIAAIAAGNTAILKPSELPDKTSKIMAEMINDHFDAGFLKVVEGGVPETTELLKQKFDKIFFTGSTKVGKIVYKAAAEHLTPVTLELGGKSPAFIFADCDLKMTAKRLVWSKYLNAGQTCIAPDYVLVQSEMETAFLEAIKAEIEKEHFAISNHNYVQIINQDNFDKLVALIEKDKVYFGGEIDASERVISPTVLHQIGFNDKCMQEEIFGPILPVLSFNSIDQALDKVVSLPKPLSAYVFTASKSNKQKVFDTLSFGGGMVNDAVMHISNSNLPFGGVGMSGMGAYHGKTGFDCFSHSKSIIEKSTWFELPLKYYPHTEARLKWIKRLMKF